VSNVKATFHKNHAEKHEPLVLKVNGYHAKITVDWAKTTSNQIYLNIEAPMEIDVLIPSTFKKLKDEIERLKAVISSGYHAL